MNQSNPIYLDNSATTKVCSAALEAALTGMRDCYGNPSSLHSVGFTAEKQVTAARKQLAAALGCLPDELIFTSGATESNNLALFGLTGAYPRAGKKIVTTAIEHPSVLEPCRRLEETGYSLTILSPDKNGRVSPEAFADVVETDTALVSFMLVNNETGALFQAEQICKAIKRKNPKTLIHIDAVQGFCKIPFRLNKIPADTVSVSGHKLYAPKGVGGLFLRKGVRLKPLVFGGGQEKGLRSGTESVPLIAAFGAAVGATFPNIEQNLAHYHALNRCFRELAANCQEITINSQEDAVPYIINLSVEGIRSETMLHFLEKRGIYVSSGSACAKGAQSHVLAAFGLSREASDSALRVSFSPETTTEQLKLLWEGLLAGLASLARR